MFVAMVNSTFVEMVQSTYVDLLLKKFVRASKFNEKSPLTAGRALIWAPWQIERQLTVKERRKKTASVGLQLGEEGTGGLNLSCALDCGGRPGLHAPEERVLNLPRMQ